MRRLFLAWAMVMLTAATSPALDPIGQLDERYDEKPAVVGASLVGLEILGPATAVDLADYAAFPLPSAGARLCLNATTRDAKYRASQAFQIRAAASSAPLGVRSRISELGRYTSDDFALKLEVRPSCVMGDAGVFVPAMRAAHGSLPTQPMTLRIALNFSLDRGFAQFQEDGAKITPARVVCSELTQSSSRKAFDHICLLPIQAELHGRVVVLKITRVGTSGTVDHEPYRVALP